ncbi:MAG: translation elongation factor Ts [Holosporaceae bacterium]|jgi:elongation factor Ts|nr:translation elongation factor Ts [Holosporaceae bacterium]
MANVTAEEVKVLRHRTGAGLMDSKRALEACNGNIEEAVDLLRKKGLAVAANKSGRVAAEGLIGVYVDGKKGVLVEVNAETDFVARNELFQKYVVDILELACLKQLCVDSLKAAKHPAKEHTVSDELTNLIAVIGENMNLRRVEHVTVSDGVVASYVHNKISPTLGKIGILVALESTGDKEKLLELGRQLAMHIAAAQSLSISVADLDPAIVERERAIVTEQAQSTGKIGFIDKIIEGRLRKFYEEVVLLEQVFVIDGETKVKDLIARVSQEIGAPITVKKFVRFALGEGIEKQTVDFAAEVAAQLK